MPSRLPTISTTPVVAKLVEGDTDSLKEFVRRWARWFESDLRKRGFSPADAYDLGFSCSTHVLTKIRAYDPEGANFNAWVITVGRNFARDWHRRNNRIRFSPLSESIPLSDSPAVAEAVPQEPAVVGLMAAIEQLSFDERRLVELCWLNGSANSRTLAREFSISIDAARVRKSRVVSKLRHLLKAASSSQKRAVTPARI